MHFWLILPLALLCVPPAVAQSGHWEGVIDIPDKALPVEVDLSKNDKGAWIGAINIPAQNLKGFPLIVSIDGVSVNLLMKGIPGDPTFQGKLATDGKSMAGDFTQGGATISFRLTRTGEPKLEAPPKSTPISKELEGSWEGVLDVSGQTLRLVLNLRNQPDGATGTLVSVNQNGIEIPLTTVTQNGLHLKIEVKSIFGSYTGDLNKQATELTGQWTQGPQTWPLTFKRAAAKQ